MRLQALSALCMPSILRLMHKLWISYLALALKAWQSKVVS